MKYKTKHRLFNSVMLAVVLLMLGYLITCLIGCEQPKSGFKPSVDTQECDSIQNSDSVPDNEDDIPMLYMSPDGNISPVPFGIPLI